MKNKRSFITKFLKISQLWPGVPSAGIPIRLRFPFSVKVSAVLCRHSDMRRRPRALTPCPRARLILASAPTLRKGHPRRPACASGGARGAGEGGAGGGRGGAGCVALPDGRLSQESSGRSLRILLLGAPLPRPRSGHLLLISPAFPPSPPHLPYPALLPSTPTLTSPPPLLSSPPPTAHGHPHASMPGG